MDQHVLVPVDTSSSSESAFEYVLEAIPGATITLFHALNPVTVLNYVTAEGFDYDRAKHKERERREAAERTFGPTARKPRRATARLRRSSKRARPPRRSSNTWSAVISITS